MALPDYSDLEAGTTITWLASGGTETLTLTSLANDAAREGDKSATLVDGTKGMPEILEIRFESSVAVAATNGKEIELFIGESDSSTAGTNNPGGLTGADAAYANPDEKKRQLNFVGSLVLSNALGTGIQKQRLRYRPIAPNIVPVIVNKSGQALSATAGNHTLAITPYYRRIKD